MDDEDRAAVLAAIVAHSPKGFWSDLGARTRQVYGDEYQQVANNPRIVPEQKIDALYQSRHFSMEWLLKGLATEHGLAVSPTVLIKNNRSYIYAAAGPIGITQAYVQAIGAMPKPAQFRKLRAEMNKIGIEPGFILDDTEPTLLELKDFYGIIAHNPVGKRFTSEQQALGMIQFCVPTPDCSDWIVEFTLHEIVAAYPVERKGTDASRDLDWKVQPKAKPGDSE